MESQAYLQESANGQGDAKHSVAKQLHPRGSVPTRPFSLDSAVVPFLAGACTLWTWQVSWPLRAIATFLVVAYLTISYLSAADAQYRGAVWTYRTKLGLLLAMVLVLVVLPLNDEARLRREQGLHTHAHDGVIQVEAAMDMVLEGRNPYAETYFDTDLGLTVYLDKLPAENPAQWYFIYLPVMFLPGIPLETLSTAVLGWYDHRLLYLLALAVAMWSWGLLARDRSSRLIATAVVALNPLALTYFIEGRNDVMLVGLLGLSLLALQRGLAKPWGLPLSGVLFGLACASKQLAWFLGPFLLLYVWRLQSEATEDRRAGARRAALRWLVPGIVTTALFLFPFFVWDPSSFWEDTISYQSGDVEHNYPIKSVGAYGLHVLLWSPKFAGFLDALAVGPLSFARPIVDHFRLTSESQTYPFWVFQLLFAVPVMLLALRTQLRRNTLVGAIVGFSVAVFAYSFFSRWLHDNYIGFFATMWPMAFLMREPGVVAEPEPTVEEAWPAATHRKNGSLGGVVDASDGPAERLTGWEPVPARLWAIVLPVLGFTALLYVPWLLISRFAYRQDVLRQSVPWFAFMRNEILEGRLPRWDPSRLAGTPHLANIQAGMFYPPNWPLIPLPPEVASALALVGHVALGGVLLALFARSLPISDGAAVLAGMAYVAGAFATGRAFAGHVGVLQATAWIPLLLLAARRLAETGSPRWAGALGAAVGLSFLGGYTAVTVYGTAAAAVLFFACLRGGDRPRQAVLLAALASVLSLLSVMPALWPLLELSGQSTRSQGLSLEEAGVWPLEPSAVPLLVWPWLMGAEPLHNFTLANPGPNSAYWHEVMSVSGLVLWTLALIGGAAYRRDPVVRVLLAIVVVSFLLALGRLTPIYTVLHQLIPPLRSFRIPSRFLVLPALLVPVLAALGLQSVLYDARRLPRRPFRGVLLPAATALFVSIVAAVAFLGGVRSGTLELKEGPAPPYLGDIRPAGLATVLLSIVCIGALCAVWSYSSRARGRGRLLLLGFYAVALTELVVVAVPSVYARAEQVPVWFENERTGGHAELPSPRGRVALHQEHSIYANWGGLHGYRSATAYDPLLLGRTANLLRSNQPIKTSNASNDIFLWQDGGIAFHLLNVGTYVNREQGKDRIVFRRDAMPRLSLVNGSRLAPTKQASLRSVLNDGFDYSKTVVLEQPVGELTSTKPPASETLVTLLEERAGYLRLYASTEVPTHLVFSESYYPGWVAQEGDRTVPLVPADHAVMAVGLSPGVYELELRFTTPWLLPAVLVGMIGALGIALLLIWERRRAYIVALFARFSHWTRSSSAPGA